MSASPPYRVPASPQMEMGFHVEPVAPRDKVLLSSINFWNVSPRVRARGRVHQPKPATREHRLIAVSLGFAYTVVSTGHPFAEIAEFTCGEHRTIRLRPSGRPSTVASGKALRGPSADGACSAPG
eukprot:746404-Rhodomonas_salina.1